MIELASDSKDFSTALAKTRLAEMTHPLQVVPIVSKPRPPPQHHHLTSTLDRGAGTANVGDRLKASDNINKI